MRKVILLVQTTGIKSVVEGEMTTLADLKHLMDVQGISYPTECEFKEAKTKTIFVDNEAVLPTNVEWKGELSNDLIMYVTTPKKKIKNGGMSRAEAYNYIKTNNLQEDVKSKFGRNFTQVSTDNLVEFIESATKTPASSYPELVDLLDTLLNDEKISEDKYNKIMDILNDKETPVEIKKKKTLDEMSFDEIVSEFNL